MPSASQRRGQRGRERLRRGPLPCGTFGPHGPGCSSSSQRSSVTAVPARGSPTAAERVEQASGGRGGHRPDASGRAARIRPMATTPKRPAVPATYEEWCAAYGATPERDAPFTTLSGEPVKPLYTEADLPAGPRREPSGSPASSRSRAASTRRCTAAACGRCASSPASARRRRPTSASATCSTTARPGCRTAFDMPSLMGHDSDHPRSLGEVGREGVAVDTLDDMETLFARHRRRRGLRVDDDQRARGDHARLLRRGRRARRASPPERLAGTIQTDILKEYIAQKEWCFPIDPAMRLVGDMIEWCSRQMPRWHPVSISRLPHPRGRLDGRAGARVHAQGRPHLRRAGGRARPGRRRLRAAAVVLLQRADRLLRGDRQVPRRPADLGARAARHASARATRASLADALPHADRRRLADRPAAAQQHRAHRDRGARRRARRHAVAAHQLLRRGARAAHRGRRARSRCARSRSSPTRPASTNTIDPLGGSYFVEALTDEMERQAYELLRARSTSSAGWSRRSSTTSRSARSPTPSFELQQRDRRAASASSSASTATAVEDETPLPILRIDPALERKQIDRVQAVRARATPGRGRAARSATSAKAPRADANLMPPLLDARPRPRHRGRDRRGAPGGLRRLHRDPGLLGGDKPHEEAARRPRRRLCRRHGAVRHPGAGRHEVGLAEGRQVRPEVRHR